MQSAPSSQDEIFECLVKPSAAASIGSDSPGTLERYAVDRSDSVVEGDILFVLDSSTEQAAVDLAQAKAEAGSEVELTRASAASSKREYDRAQELHIDKLISDQDLDDLKSKAKRELIQFQQALDEREILVQELTSAHVALEQRTIRSPFTGVVVERLKSEGEHVDDQPVIRIASVDPLHIETTIPIDYLRNITPGMSATVSSEAFPGEFWVAKVDRIDTIADGVKGAYGVRLVLPNPGKSISAGLRCQVAFEGKPQTFAQSTGLPRDGSSSYRYNAGSNAGLNSVTLAASSTQAIPPIGAARSNLQAHGKSVDALDPIVDIGSKEVMIDCLESQMYKTRAEAVQAASQWEQKSVKVTVVQKEQTEKVGHRVVSPLLPSRSAAAKYVTALEAAGISDYFLPSNEAPVRVSLGAFKQNEMANSLLERLNSSGIAVERLPWKKQIIAYTLTSDTSVIKTCD